MVIDSDSSNEPEPEPEPEPEQQRSEPYNESTERPRNLFADIDNILRVDTGITRSTVVELQSTSGYTFPRHFTEHWLEEKMRLMRELNSRTEYIKQLENRIVDLENWRHCATCNFVNANGKKKKF